MSIHDADRQPPSSDEIQFHRFFENAQEGIAIIQDEAIVIGNISLSRVFKRTLAELTTDGLESLVREEHRSSVAQYLRACQSGAQDLDRCEFQGQTVTDSPLWVKFSGSLIEWDSNPAVLCSFRDISENKQKELDLAKQCDRMALALGIVNEGVWDWRTDTGEVYFNTVWYTMLGYAYNELPQDFSTWQKLVHPEDLAEAEKSLALHLEKAAPFNITVRMRSKSGEYLWIKSKGQVVEKDDAGRALRMIGTHLDVTEKTLSEEALKESEERFKAFSEASSGGIGIHDNGIMLDCNPRLSEITGYTRDELIGMNGLLLIGEQSRNDVLHNMSTGYEKPYEVVGVCKNGNEYPLQVEARNVSFNGKQVRVVEFRDITEIKRSREEQALLKARLEALWHVSRMVEADYADLCDMILNEAKRMTSSKYSFFGLVKDNILSLQSWSPEVQSDCSVKDKSVQITIHKGSFWSEAVEGRRELIVNSPHAHLKQKGVPEGHVPINKVLLVPVISQDTVVALAAVANKDKDYTEDDASQLRAFVESVVIIMDRRKMESELKASEGKLTMALEMASMGHWELDIKTMTFTFNEQFYSIYGTTSQQEGGMTMAVETYTRSFVHPDDIVVVSEETTKILNREYDESPVQIEHRIICRNGKVRHVVVCFTVVNDEFGTPLKVIGVNQDITARKNAEEKIRYLATHDALTGLPSLRLARDRITQAGLLAKRKSMFAAILFIDLDGFKNVNDTLGHDAGDELLRETARRLNSCVREMDTVARIGGDEFLVVLNELRSKSDAGVIADKMIKSISAPFSYMGNEVFVGASIGISLWCPQEKSSCADELIKKADSAMYSVKKSGKNRYAYAD
ncbi:PAS domain S-box protein [Maridesulfovibrio sp.]|uniref:PAS domain S-box protein n=1 Tax=Maridesulfovibrio sp. TaxID=2795000 RepID=UPI002A18D587|nr:PAS domain S-box protein [Maridesulfovibrio sp.]